MPAPLPIQPHLPAASDRYGRLFPEAPASTLQKMTPSALGSLALSMRRNRTTIPLNLIQGHAPPAIAITYFGQFVDHDLTSDSTPLRQAGSCGPNFTINNRTPWLDLDSVYGDGPGSKRHHHLYESDNASFRIGHSPFGGEPFDIPFGEDGEPALADDRNGENLILRQIHAMFLKLHNVAVRELPISLPPRERFDRARDRVRWQYQWLVRTWFLRQICHPEIYGAVIEKEDRRIDWQKDGFAIPVEFSVATMRFGHSMVRPEYQLNGVPVNQGGSGIVPLANLFGVKNNGPLDSSLKIDWRLLSRDSAMSIDTSLVEPLFHLPHEHIDLYVRTPIPHPPNALSFRTLLRGAAVRLATGQQVRDVLGEPPISATSPLYKIDPWAALRAVGLEQETPLWYYTLLEAQLDCVGASLGRVGSRIAAEVIEASLLSDPASYLRAHAAAKPPAWKMADGKEIEVKSLQDLAQVAGV